MADAIKRHETPATFSYKEASDALDELFAAVAKSKRPEYLGHLNEIGVYLQTVNGFFRVGFTADKDKTELVDNKPISEVLKEYIERVSEERGGTDD